MQLKGIFFLCFIFLILDKQGKLKLMLGDLVKIHVHCRHFGEANLAKWLKQGNYLYKKKLPGFVLILPTLEIDVL